jgi:hypothetical protein
VRAHADADHRHLADLRDQRIGRQRSAYHEDRGHREFRRIGQRAHLLH